MKPRIFIGSSKEGLNVAEYIKNFFSADYDCIMWNEDIFKENENFLETLTKSASLFDFGFMVFAADDVSVVRHKKFETPRDNVLFEYGLFLGRLGTDRAFIIQDAAAKLPSDLLGITISSYNSIEDDGKMIPDWDVLHDSLVRLKKNIDDKVRLGHLGMLPSTVVAISYFDNFVKLVAEWINTNEPTIDVNGTIYKTAKLKVVIPSDLDADLKKRATIFYKKKGLEDSQMQTVHRSFPIHVSAKGDGDVLEIFDMPTILNGIDKAIEMYFRVGHIGKTSDQQLAEDHELNNFEHVLKLLIEQDAFCKNCIEIVSE